MLRRHYAHKDVNVSRHRECCGTAVCKHGSIVFSACMTRSALCRTKGQLLCHDSQRMCDSAGRSEASTQNHMYAVDPNTLPE